MVLALFFIVADVSGQTWELAHATFYGNDTGEETMRVFFQHYALFYSFIFISLKLMLFFFLFLIHDAYISTIIFYANLSREIC